MNPSRGIGPGTVDKIRAFAQMQKSSSWMLANINALWHQKDRSRKAIWDFANLILDLREKIGPADH